MLYLQNGYVNIPYIVSLGMPFNFMVGGRGTGKTYGALKYIIENEEKFLFMRRREDEIDIMLGDEFNPFRKLESDLGWHIMFKRINKHSSGIYMGERNLEGEIEFNGAPRGKTAALSTIAHMRGFDASDVQFIVFDEFIKEPHLRAIKEEGKAFLNAYETICRNRELEGKPPVTVLGCANSEELGNDLFLELGIVSKVEHMKRNGQEMSIIKERGLAIFLLDDSRISKQKQSTALYKLAQRDSEFTRMALGNKFKEITDISTGHMSLKEYRPIVTIGEITAYKHKSRAEYYVTTHSSGSPAKFTTSDTERARFFRLYSYLWEAYMRNKIIFEDSTCEILFNKYFE